MKKQPRKTRRQLLAEKHATAQRTVYFANALENPMETLTKFNHHKLKDGQEMKVTCCRVRELDEPCINWICDLMQRNMEDIYKKSSWGWNFERKKHELTEDVAYYLIASIGETNVGFSHFRFDLDDEVDVLYCYELQLEENFRRKGIGKFLLQALEAIGKKTGVQKVVLTVFKRNTAAWSFFTSLGYKPDITNPAESHQMDYTILSKRC